MKVERSFVSGILMLYDINYMFQDVVENSFLVDLCDVRQQSLRTEHSDIRMFLLGDSQH